MAATLAGNPFSCFCGFLENGNSAAIESLVYCDEVIGMARRIVAGIEVSVEALAEEVIAEVKTGNFLAEDQTVERMYDCWAPGIFTRDSHEKWTQNGGKDLRSRCIERVDEIVKAGPKLSRDPKLLKEIDAIIAKCEADCRS
jgi:trimethylamine--corrinoid protein Co-methyltransferase